ncbi:MAG: 50S ribosomal protein L10 [Patescibacteria group bacterium]|nr:50S ribosomal protein L10 [Patescibacteria group bacterium]
MKKQEKIYQVQNLEEKIKLSKAIAFASYQGLNVEKITSLRKEIKKKGGELEISKNTLLTRAFENAGLKLEKALEGPNAVVWAYEDEVSPLKTLFDFSKENEALKIKNGFLGKELVDLEKLTYLASLPSMDELRAKVVGGLISPISGLCNNLRSNLLKLVLVLKNAQITKEQ